jgi:Mor family transcriptional regulator
MYNLPIQEIIEKYLNGMNMYEIAKEYKCARGTIRKRLCDNGIKIRTNSESHIGLNRGEDHLDYIDLPLEKIYEGYLGGVSSVDLAKEYKCSYSTIICRLRDNGIEIRSSHDSHIGLQKGKDSSHYIILPIKEISEKYLNGISSVDLAKEYGCTDSTITRRLRDNGIKIRSMSESRIGKRIGKDNPKYIDLPINEISEKYLFNMSTIELAEEYKCSIGTICKKLRDNGINVTIESHRHQSATVQGISYHEWEKYARDHLYCSLFSPRFKEKIRILYNRKCFMCGKSEEENGQRLDVHHVNYDKDCLCGLQCEFVPLCKSCHGRTGVNRKYWENLIMGYLYSERYFMVDL